MVMGVLPLFPVPLLPHPPPMTDVVAYETQHGQMGMCEPYAFFLFIFPHFVEGRETKKNNALLS